MNLCASGALCTASCSIAPSSRGIATYSTTTTALKIFANNARSCSRVADYPTDELLQLHSAVRFLRNIFVNVSGIRVFCAIFCILRVGADAVPRDSSPADTLSTGPSGALRAWDARTFSVLEDDIDFRVVRGRRTESPFRGISLPSA
jgi:hypothetical protein